MRVTYTRDDLPEPSCPQGYNRVDIDRILGLGTPYQDTFWDWMCGQTMSICNGSAYRYNRKHGEWCKYGEDCGDQIDQYGYGYRCDYVPGGEYVDTPCGQPGHGTIVYSQDLLRFLNGLPVID